MAVEFTEKAARTSEYGFLPEQLEVIPGMNGRHELPDVSWIVDSILRHGQLQPVTIRRTGGKPVLVAGFSRWRAVHHINENALYEKEPIRLRCSYTALNEKQAFLANIEENRVRNQTTPMDDAYNIQRLINIYQYKEAEVAEVYRASVAWVKSRLTLIELVPEAEKAVREGRADGAAAKEIAKLSSEVQRKVAKTKGKITAADVRKIAPAKAPKPVKHDAELIRRINAVIEDVNGALLEDESEQYVEVDRRLLFALANYIKR